MADNYLEHRMADLQSGNIKREISAYSKRRGKLHGKNVVIGLLPADELESLVKEYRRQGTTVDFFATDRTAGTLLARATGSCFHPIDPDDLVAWHREFAAIRYRRHHIDLLLGALPESLHL